MLQSEKELLKRYKEFIKLSIVDGCGMGCTLFTIHLTIQSLLTLGTDSQQDSQKWSTICKHEGRNVGTRISGRFSMKHIDDLIHSEFEFLVIFDSGADRINRMNDRGMVPTAEFAAD